MSSATDLAGMVAYAPSESNARFETALERFKSEIRLARKISHRGVVRTHDLGEARGLYFVTMEFVEGTSLKELVRSRGRLPAAVLLPIARQRCRALEVAHEARTLHDALEQLG